MLNPSTADASQDDPTIRRCIGFSKSWGYGGLAVANLFALRSSNPAILDDASDPVGPLNDDILSRLVEEADMVVAAWGSHRVAKDRARQIRPILGEARCLGVTRSGDPRHPLYVRATVEPQPLAW
jgi:hypothetical protein